MLVTKSKLISSSDLQFIRFKLEECLDIVSQSTLANGINSNANARKAVVEMKMKQLMIRNTAFCITGDRNEMQHGQRGIRKPGQDMRLEFYFI